MLFLVPEVTLTSKLCRLQNAQAWTLPTPYSGVKNTVLIHLKPIHSLSKTTAKFKILVICFGFRM
jgi:hypothetical protein